MLDLINQNSKLNIHPKRKTKMTPKSQELINDFKWLIKPSIFILFLIAVYCVFVIYGTYTYHADIAKQFDNTLNDMHVKLFFGFASMSILSYLAFTINLVFDLVKRSSKYKDIKKPGWLKVINEFCVVYVLLIVMFFPSLILYCLFFTDKVPIYDFLLWF